MIELNTVQAITGSGLESDLRTAPLGSGRQVTLIRAKNTLGKGGIAAMMGHGGLCLKIIQTGKINVGDTMCLHHPQQGLF